MPLLATNAAGAESFHAVANAADRLKKAGRLQVQVDIAPTDEALARAIHGNRMNQTIDALKRKGA